MFGWRSKSKEPGERRYGGAFTGFRDVGREVGESAARIKSIYKSAFKPKTYDVPGIPAEIVDAGERFMWLAKRMGLNSQRALADMEKSFGRKFHLAAWPLILMLGFGVVMAQKMFEHMGLIGVLLSFLFVPYLAAAAFDAGLCGWQVRTRRLGGLGQFLRSPGEWLPRTVGAKAGPSSFRRKAGKFVAIAAFVTHGLKLSVGSAYAWGLGGAASLTSLTSTTSTTGEAERLVTALTGTQPSGAGIGSAVMAIVSGTTNPWTFAISSFSSLLLALGVATLTYHVLHSMVHAAQSGQVMNKYFTPWSTIRATIGTGLLVPAFPSGLSAIHALVFVVAALGTAMGNQVLDTFTTQVVSNGLVPSGAVDENSAAGVPTAGMDSAYQFLALEGCYSAFNLDGWDSVASKVASPYYSPGSGDPPAQGVKQAPLAGVTDTSGMNQVWDYGRCGSLSLPSANPANGDPVYLKARLDAFQSALSSIRSSGVPDKMASSFGVSPTPPTTRVPDPWPVTAPATMTPIAQQLEKSLRHAASQALLTASNSATKTLQTMEQQYGWMSAGMVWLPLVQASQQVSTMADQPANFQAHDFQDDWVHGVRPLSPNETTAEAINRRMAADRVAAATTSGLDDTARSLASIGDNTGNMIDRVLNPIMSRVAIAVGNLTNVDAGSQNPMQRMMNFGRDMIDVGWVGIAATVTAATLTGNAPAWATGLAAAFTSVSPYMMTVILFCFGIGIMQAYVLPMLPYLAVLWGALGWIVQVCELLIAGPIVAFTLMRFDGDELFTQVQQHAKSSFISLLLRPAILMLSFCMMYTLFPLVIGWVTTSLVPSFVANQGGHATGIVGILTLVVFSCYVQHQVAKWVLHLVTQMPDRIAAYWGGRPEGHGEQQHTDAGVSAIAGAAGGAFGAARGVKVTTAKQRQDAREQQAAAAAQQQADSQALQTIASSISNLRNNP